MHPPRFRLRALMIAVAVAALALGVEAMRRRRAECLRRAAFIACSERWSIEVAAMVEDPNIDLEGNASYYRDHPIEVQRAIQKLASARRAHEHVARHPWLPVPPDPFPHPE